MFIFISFLVGCLVYIGKAIERKNQNYNTYERELVEYAKIYFAEKKMSLGVGESIEINMNTLIEEELLKTSKVNEDECNGFVTVKRNIDGYSYTPYIKCNKYESVTN